MPAEPLDQLLARARQVDGRDLPPAFTTTVLEQAAAAPRRRSSPATIALWSLAFTALALGAALLLSRQPAAHESPPPLPLFEARDFPQSEP